jgi:cation diffusion facilitator CzcD-associated flavoprotein CzcO
VAVVGGGFGGVGAAVLLRRAGYDNVTVFERGGRVGGVWHHNTYPGAACDVPSHLYEFSFAPNPNWSRRYAPQQEIQAYLEDVASRYGVRDRIRTSTEVLSARWDEMRNRWLIKTSGADHEADILITACGQLSVPKLPALKISTPSKVRHSTPPSGGTMSTSRASASRWSEAAVVPFRWCRQSSRTWRA